MTEPDEDRTSFKWVSDGLRSYYEVLEHVDEVTELEEDYLHLDDFVIDLIRDGIELDGGGRIVVRYPDESPDTVESLRAAVVKMSHQIVILTTAHRAATTVVQIYGDKLMIDQISDVGAWPEQVEALMEQTADYLNDGTYVLLEEQGQL